MFGFPKSAQDNMRDDEEQQLKKAAKVLDALLSQALPEPEAAIRSALGSAMLTPDTALTEEQKLWLDVLRR